MPHKNFPQNVFIYLSNLKADAAAAAMEESENAKKASMSPTSFLNNVDYRAMLLSFYSGCVAVIVILCIAKCVTRRRKSAKTKKNFEMSQRQFTINLDESNVCSLDEKL